MSNDPLEYLIHAVQSGVAAMMEVDRKETEPKHLRVGVSAAMCDHGALVKCLLDKGVFTVEEYLAARKELLEAEVRAYEMDLSAYYGKKINLM